MNNKLLKITGITAGVILLFQIYSLFICPLSVEHGTYVSLAKYMAQGNIPYQELQLPETPVGIGILSLLYLLLGQSASAYWASGLMFIVQLVNIGLLIKIMQRIRLEKAAIGGGICLYLLMVYSSDGLMLRMETFSAMFLLAAFQQLLRKTKGSMLWAGLLFVLAVGCKQQSIVMLPVLAIPAFWQGKHHRFKAEKGGLFCTSSITFLIIGYILIATISGNEQWISMLDWTQTETNPFKTTQDIWYNRLLYVIIQAGRCSLFFFLCFIPIWKSMKGYGKRVVIIGISAFICCSTLYYWQIQVPYFIVAYPFIAIVLAQLMHVWIENKKALIIWICTLFIPGSLSIRELLKLEFGTVKNDQQEEISALKNIIKQPGTALVLFDNCYEFELGPQIFSEVAIIRPGHLKDSKLGMEKIDLEHELLLQQISEVDYVILNEDGFTALSYSASSDLFFDIISDMKSYGTGKLIVYARK